MDNPVSPLPDEVVAALNVPVGEGPLSPLATPSVTRAVLNSFGLATKKKLGQNFLINDAILKKIASLADLSPEDYVLEVGPGIGTLTVALLKSAGRVVSVERDPDLPQVLVHTTAPWADRFALLSKDGLDLQEDDVRAEHSPRIAQGEGLDAELSPQVPRGEGANPEPPSQIPLEESLLAAPSSDQQECACEGLALPNKFVANLPYAVAATLILDYFERFAFVQSATVMVQREVADRIAAAPGSKNYGAYTVKLGMYAQVVDRFIVSPNNFFPPPHVDSAVVRLDRAPVLDAEGNPLTVQEISDACKMADAAFASRRKTLSNSFKTYFSGRGAKDAALVDKLPNLFERADIDARRRGETLDQQEFITLARAYRSLVEGK